MHAHKHESVSTSNKQKIYLEQGTSIIIVLEFHCNTVIFEYLSHKYSMAHALSNRSCMDCVFIKNFQMTVIVEVFLLT